MKWMTDAHRCLSCSRSLGIWCTETIFLSWWTSAIYQAPKPATEFPWFSSSGPISESSSSAIAAATISSVTT
jgi:hypothetical protein